jgi:hypothetical protein
MMDVDTLPDPIPDNGVRKPVSCLRWTLRRTPFQDGLNVRAEPEQYRFAVRAAFCSRPMMHMFFWRDDPFIFEHGLWPLPTRDDQFKQPLLFSSIWR